MGLLFIQDVFYSYNPRKYYSFPTSSKCLRTKKERKERTNFFPFSRICRKVSEVLILSLLRQNYAKGNFFSLSGSYKCQTGWERGRTFADMAGVHFARETFFSWHAGTKSKGKLIHEYLLAFPYIFACNVSDFFRESAKKYWLFREVRDRMYSSVCPDTHARPRLDLRAPEFP